jgi:Variant SH3 domain.
MKKTAWFLVVLAATALFAADKALVVQVLRTRLLAQPDFLSASLCPLQKGNRLELLEAQGSWYQVRSAGGVKGFVHSSAVMESRVTLGGIAPGPKGASQDELALAAKGFDEGNEKKLRNSTGYNFADLGWVMEQEVDVPALARFVRDGRLK